MKYWAFLSYSHTDRRWADWLHKALETYRVPRRLVGKESREGQVPKKVYPIFRDREELPVSADLGVKINEALRESRYLIVICSPRSAQSRWVGEEITTYKKLGREDRILALIVDGEPNASDGKPGFKAEDECFHEAMRYRWSMDGQRSQVRSEPIAADMRQGKDGKENAKLKLLAGLLGVNYDDLKRREQERRIRRLRIVLAVALGLVSAFAALSVYAWQQKRSAEQTLSRSDFLQALRSIDEGNDYDALAQLTRSLSFDRDNQAAACRLITLLTYHEHTIPLQRLKHDDSVKSAQFSPDGKRIVTASDKTTRIWDAQTGKLLTDPMKHDGAVLSAQFSPDGKRIVTASSDKTARIWDAQTGKPLTDPMKHDDAVLSAQFSPNGKRIVTTSKDKTARIWDAQTGKPLTDPMKHDGSVISAQFSPDGKRIVTDSSVTARIWDISPTRETPPEWLLRLASAVAGQRLNDRGVFEPLSENSVDVLNQVKDQLSHEPADDDWAIWGQWFLADGSTRTISPFSKVMVPEYIENRIKENTSSSLDEAEELAFGNAQLLERIQQAREGLNQKGESPAVKEK
jgi:dipeptidyl aminopeptidase/acylaminoacyl peptidase